MTGSPVFQKATKRQAKLRMAIDGPSGSGKTFTALTFATALSDKVAVIDTERGSASKYADMFSFDVLELDTFHPNGYIGAIQAAEDAGYAVIVIDSLSHAWEGEGGVLDLHEQATKRQPSQNSWTAWRDVTPIHRDLVDAMLQSKCHVIATMRSKMDYIQTTDDKGRSMIKKVGMAPVQRQGMEYEFDIVGDMDLEHTLTISKTRCFVVADAVITKPTAAWFAVVKNWLSDGQPVKEVEKPTPQPETPKAHWIDTPEVRSKFWAWTRNMLTLSDEQVHQALGVEHIHDYAGTMIEAKTAIENWVKAQAK